MTSLSERAYATIYEWIVTGKLKKGEATSELALCAELDMSRTPVRQALQRLEHEGFLNIVPKHGIIILDSSAQRVSDLLDILIPFLLFAVHSLSLTRQHVLKDVQEKAIRKLQQLEQASPICSDTLVDFEYETILAIIKSCENEEMTKQFRLTTARLFWSQNKKRWQAPYHHETSDVFSQLLASVNDPATFHEAAFRYLQNLKNTWT